MYDKQTLMRDARYFAFIWFLVEQEENMQALAQLRGEHGTQPPQHPNQCVVRKALTAAGQNDYKLVGNICYDYAAGLVKEADKISACSEKEVA